MAHLQSYPKFRVLLPDGTPAVAYKLYSYLAGTTTPTPLYKDQAQASQHTNPALTDGNGEITEGVWLAPNIAYKLVLQTDASVDVWTLDNIGTAEGMVLTTLTVNGAATFATITASGQIASTVPVGIPPFVITSTTKSPNLNADLLDGKQWDAPGPIGGTTPDVGAFSFLSSSSLASLNGGLGVAGATDLVGNSSVNGTLTQKGVFGELGTIGQASEEITLSTLSGSTDSVAFILPANALILGITARITVAITGATAWSVGDPTTTARFITSNTDLIVATTKVGLNHLKGSVTTEAAGPTQTTAAKVRIATTGTPTAGKIRVTVFYISFTPATS